MSSASLRQWGVYSLTAETSDTSPSLLLCFDQARYIFNAGEGTTRAFVAKAAGFRKLGTVFTTRADSETASGLPGLLLTLSEHHGDQSVVTDLDIVGPPKVSHMIATARFHARRNMTEMRVHETLPAESAKEPIYEDSCVRIYDFAVRAAPAPLRGLKRKRSTSPVHHETNGSTKKHPPHYTGAEAKDWLRQVLGDMFHGPEYSYRGPRPSPAWDAQLLPKLSESESDIVTSYLVVGPQQRGRFLPEKAKAQGVPKGTLFGKLAKGERIELEDGRVVEPESCRMADGPRNAFLLVDCRDEQSLKQLPTLPIASMAANDKASIKVIFHLLGPGVADLPAYWQWAKSLGDVEHVVSSPDLAADHIAFGGAFLLGLRLAKLAPDMFPIPHYLLQPKLEGLPPKTTLWTADCRWELGSNGQFAFASLPRHYDLELGTAEAQKRIAQLHLPGISPRDAELTKAGNEAWSDFIRLSEQAKVEIAKEADSRVGIAAHPLDDVKVTNLGTGSAAPSVYRNVSGTLIEIPETGGLLLDCGEGTLGQLRRLRGPERAAQALRALRIICISHMHGDHHAGLGPLLHARASVVDVPPLTLIAPRLVWLGLQDHDRIESLDLDNVTFVNAASLLSERITTPSAALESLGLKAIRSVEVDHRGGQCFGFVIDSAAPWRIVYSGDTRPCGKLVTAGKGADLLIHEATLDDEHVQQAKLKGHSTTGQAIDIARQMGAKKLLLTHFSQRYPKLTTISPDLLAQEGLDVVLAFDGMQTRMADTWKGKHYLPAMQALLRDLGAKPETAKMAID